MMNSRVAVTSFFTTLALLIAAASVPLHGQSSTSASGAVVPTLVSFSGMLADNSGKPLTGVTGVTFALYAEPQGGAPLWLETQNVLPDATGNYSVMLGSTSSQGLPPSLFVSGQARWLGVQAQGQAGQPRVMLLSVPYAMKAGDADTLGGLPASAYRVSSSSGTQAVSAPSSTGGTQAASKTVAQPSTISGTMDYVAKFTDTKDDLGNSEIYDTGKAVGIGTTTPGALFDTHATTAGIHDPELQVGSSGTTDSNSIKVYNGSDLIDIFLSGITNGFMPGTSPGDGGWRVDVGHNLFFGDKNNTRFVLLSSGNAGIATTTPAFTLDVEGGGVINAATSYNLGGQIFAYGSYSFLNAFLGFAGNMGMIGGQNTAVGGQALYSGTTGAWNTAVGYRALYSDTSGGDNVAIGVNVLPNNTTGGYNTGLGVFALNLNTTGTYNTASGFCALCSNTTGVENTAAGDSALLFNTTGGSNTAVGSYALNDNTTGTYNTASGFESLPVNTTGSSNTAIGYSAGSTLDSSRMTGSDDTFLGNYTAASTGTLSNATAIGNNAVVSESNALVLGCVSGLGLCPAAVSVGIGTAAPSQVFTIGKGLGHAIADGWDTYSSRRWKTNIATLRGALAKVEQLRGVSYDLKANGKHEIGVIAEEVGSVVPEVVSWDNNGKDAVGVDYSRLTALLIEATKEEKALITMQQKQIRSQQAQIARLASQVKSIQASLRISGHPSSEVRTVKTHAPTVQQ